jgi:signal transduction histidine kinase
VKFTVDGGQVTLRARRVPRADVGVLPGSWKGRRTFRCRRQRVRGVSRDRVTDTGIGISPEGLEQLFKPFSQIDSGLARKFEGTGLGLAMVKLLAELHGGAVAVQSAVGEGSCFTVWLPLRAAEQEAARRTAKAPSSPPSLGSAPEWPRRSWSRTTSSPRT